MKIQCDVCEKAPAAVICCADEAALCADCDVQVHAANKLASKHQRLLLECLSNKLPRCDICQEKTAFIFCVEDRALFCHGCDESIHVEGSLSGKHQRLLATGIRVGLGSSCNSKGPVQNFSEPSNMQMQPLLGPEAAVMVQREPSPLSPSMWSIDDFLQLSDYESGDKRGSPELEWVADNGLFHEQTKESTLLAAEVPELSMPPARTANLCKSNTVSKKPRLEDDGFFIVPDLG